MNTNEHPLNIIFLLEVKDKHFYSVVICTVSWGFTNREVLSIFKDIDISKATEKCEWNQYHKQKTDGLNCHFKKECIHLINEKVIAN